MKFAQWLENKVLLEGKKGKGKKPQVVTEPKKQDNIIKLKPLNPWDVGKGHQSHISGSGTHDARPKRQRTRKASNDASIKEF
jgi:hypothetical protein